MRPGRAAGNWHGPRFASGTLGSAGTMPGRIVPSRPISHSAAEHRLRHDVLAVGQHLDVLGEAERQAGEVDGAHQSALKLALVAA